VLFLFADYAVSSISLKISSALLSMVVIDESLWMFISFDTKRNEPKNRASASSLRPLKQTLLNKVQATLRFMKVSAIAVVVPPKRS
jgi:hypothetical protein